MSTMRAIAFPAAGLFAGAAAWGTSTLLGFAWAPKACTSGIQIPLFIAAGAIVFSLLGLALSWRADRKLQAINVAPAMPARGAHVFLAKLGALAATLFAFAAALQVAAALILSSCQR